MENVIIFGCGAKGKSIYSYYKDKYNIIYFSDNNHELWGKKVLDIEILSPKELMKFGSEIKIIVAAGAYAEILSQLQMLGIDIYQNAYYAGPFNNFLNKISKVSAPYELIGNNSNFENEKTNNVRKVLFLYTMPHHRITNLAVILKARGIIIDFAYFEEAYYNSHETLNVGYRNIFRAANVNEMMQIIRNSDCDVIHSFGEISYNTLLALRAGKPVVHDAVDIGNMYRPLHAIEQINENLAINGAHGNIFMTESVRKLSVEIFELNPQKPMLTLGNFLERGRLPIRYHDKLSESDGKIHCVYEGAMSNQKDNLRYIETALKIMGDNEIHVHFYTNFNREEECEYYQSLESDFIHWEGEVDYKKLIEEMTKYDIALFYVENYNLTNVPHCAYTSPNKIFEYLGAGLPVAINGIPKISEYIRDNKFGDIVDFDGNILEQFKKIIECIKIDKILLDKNNLIMDNHVDALLHFYQDTIHYAKNLL